MKKEYFIIKNGSKEGAFTFDELVQHDIYDNDLIWKSGWKDWTKASEVDKLSDYVIVSPPLTFEEKKKITSKNKNKKVKQLLKSNFIDYLVLFGGLIFIVTGTYYFFAKEGGSIQNPIYLTKEEKINPILIIKEIIPITLMISFLMTFLFVVYDLRKQINQK